MNVTLEKRIVGLKQCPNYFRLFTEFKSFWEETTNRWI